MSTKRIVRSVELSPAAAQALKRIKEEDGQSVASIISTVLEWYTEQPPSKRLAIIGWRQRHVLAEREADADHVAGVG